MTTTLDRLAGSDEFADQAAPLDALLVDAALGTVRRFAPDRSAAKLVAALARRPRTTGRRVRSLAVELARIGTGTSTVAPAKRDRRFTDPAWTENGVLHRQEAASLRHLVLERGYRPDERRAARGFRGPGDGQQAHHTGSADDARHPIDLSQLRADSYIVAGIADQLTREELSYLRRTRDFVDDEVLPVINGFWERAEFPRPLIEKLAKLGVVGSGILLDFPVMRHMADIEAIHTYEGTETIQTLIVGRDITGASAFA